MDLKSRSYTCTVNLGHVAGLAGPEGSAASGPLAGRTDLPQDNPPPPSLPGKLEGPPEAGERFANWLDRLGELFDDSVIDYAVISLEESKTLRPHLQGFICFNESAFEDKRKPSDWLEAHWLKARSLSGARDYCAAVGIHIRKEGLYSIVEYGNWVDPGWNTSLRSRLIYQVAAEIEAGATLESLAHALPAAVLLIGPQNIGNVADLRAGPKRLEHRSLATSPYCYIGRTNLAEEFLNSEEFSSFSEASQRAQCLEEE